MAVPSLKRSLAAATLGTSLLLTGLLSACGDDDGSTQQTVNIQPSTYSTIVSTTAAAAAAPASGGAAGGTVAGTQVYTVQQGDFLGAIAEDFGIPPESIAAFNRWEDGVQHMLHPDQEINIPPGAQVPSADDDEDEEDSGDAEDSEETDSDSEEPEETDDPDEPATCPNGDPQGTYTIEDGDIPALVAQSLDVTVDQLNEANANTPGYGAFIVDLEILVPCGEEDE